MQEHLSVRDIVKVIHIGTAKCLTVLAAFCARLSETCASTTAKIQHMDIVPVVQKITVTNIAQTISTVIVQNMAVMRVLIACHIAKICHTNTAAKEIITEIGNLAPQKGRMTLLV